MGETLRNTQDWSHRPLGQQVGCSSWLGSVEPLVAALGRRVCLPASQLGRLTSSCVLGQETLCSQNCELGDFYF